MSAPPNRLITAAFCATLALPAGAHAQQPRPSGAARSAIHGVVVDRHSGRPVPGARVVIFGLRDTINAGEDGRFATDSAAVGTHVVEVAAIGYTAARWILELGQDPADVRFEIDASPPLLDTLDVTGEHAILDSNDWRSPASFERRRHRGGGQFLTFEQIRHSHARTLGDLLPLIPGVMVECSNRNCAVLMNAAMHACPVEYYLDGAPASFSTGPSFPVVGVRAIEVYRPSEVPIEFAKPNNTCGVIAIWTKMER